MYNLEIITVELDAMIVLLVSFLVVDSTTASPLPQGCSVSVLPAEPGAWSPS